MLKSSDELLESESVQRAKQQQQYLAWDCESGAYMLRFGVFQATVHLACSSRLASQHLKVNDGLLQSAPNCAGLSLLSKCVD